MANLKNITDLPVAESADGLNLIVNDNGTAKQIAAGAVGGGVDMTITLDIRGKGAALNEYFMVENPDLSVFSVNSAEFNKCAEKLKAGVAVSVVVVAREDGMGVVDSAYTPWGVCCIPVDSMQNTTGVDEISLAFSEILTNVRYSLTMTADGVLSVGRYTF